MLQKALGASRAVDHFRVSNIVLAMRRGDLRLLRHALEEHEDRSLSRPRKARASGVSTTGKEIYIIQKQKDPSKAHQIKLEVIVKALKWLEMEIDLDEVKAS
nr:enhanced ethylene response protein 5 [Tanacetum cinerariifolium]